MKPKNLYPNEKFSNAITTLATSPKSIQERIADAFIFDIIHVKAKDVPEDIQYRLEKLQKKMTSVEPISDEGRIIATTRNMTTDEAVEIANEIVYLADIINNSSQ
ncbi:MAG: hypothetical protein B6I26_04890 [Desulfobacteraceae bacterium 4572_130]|nr:MAG: hypothetical protein B6I26_04890 [Desulfobacteraceae bacterium 4572_130]